MRALIATLTLALAACQPAIQTISAADYLARGPIADPAIRAAAQAQGEPDLRFPARIGLAQVSNGRLTTTGSGDAEMFERVAGRHRALGEWVALSPFLHRREEGVSLTDQLRRTAARQHLDYLLVYEVGARPGPTGDTPFALADVTLIGGAVLPTRVTRAQGIGNAIFLDVRSGYPYGTVSATEDLTGLARSFGTRQAEANLRARAERAVVRELLPEVEEMLARLAAAARRG